MNINKKHKLLSKFLIFLMSAFLMLSMTMTAFAATQTGHGEVAYAGATKNTFAAGMPLSEIYFVTDQFSTYNETIEITDNTSGALEIDHRGEKVRIKGGNLSHNTLDNQIKGQYQSTFKDAAILPDGTVKDVVLTFDIGRVLTAEVGDSPLPNHVTIHHNSNADDKAINIVANTESAHGTGVEGAFFGVAVEKKVTISVDGAGDFVVPFFGFNQNRNIAGSYISFRTAHGEAGYDAAIETVKVPDTANTFYPAENDTYISVDDGTFIERGGTEAQYIPPTNSGGQCGSDSNGYRSGFATIGQSGFTAIVNSPCSENASQPFPNNQYIALGDLIHRIWSGSGPHGKIETGKSGTGTGLAGGSFTGAVPSGFPATNTETQNLMRYVVPDAKEKVTYTMTPDKGYTMDTLVVDGTTYTVPKIPEGASITTYDGNGALTYLGGGKFTFEFTNANTQDHEIYVTWRKVTADIIVSKVWRDNSKASGVSANVKLTWGSNSESKPVPSTDGLVYKWEDMDVFEYDANGVAGDPITYTLEEDPDPVSDDYVKGVWSGVDKEGGTADGGFNLTDDSKDNKAREKDDPFTPTVTNTLKKDVEITKKWNDQNNRYNTRPSDVAGMFKLYNAADSTEVTGITPTVTAGTNEHTIKWAGLPKIDASGNELTYYAVETEPAGYTSDSSDAIVNEGGEIENVLETKDVSITKTWDDEGDAEDKRPAPSAMTSSFTLYNDQAMTSAVSATPSVTDNRDNTYTVKWTDLPAKDANGSITYYVKETAVPSEYKITEGTDGVSENGIITNKFTIKPPTGKDDKSYGGKGDPQEGKPEFTKGTGNIPPTGAYTLLDGDTPVDELTIPGEGRYTIDKDTGVVTFIPEPDFVGPGTGVTVQVTDEFGEKATAEYTPTVVNNTQTVSKEQKINYHYSDGSPVLDSEGNPLVRTRSAEYTREGKVDPKTGEITSWDPWVPVKFDNIDSPGIEGYTPDKATVTGGSFTPDNWPADVDVIYTKESPVPPKPDDPTPPDDPADDPADDYPDVNPTDDDTSAGSTGVRTGDAANVIVWIVILAAVISAVTYLIIRRRTNE